MVDVITFSTATDVQAVKKLGLNVHVWIRVIKSVRMFLFYC